jgi:predicted nucleic acid-binding protein
MLSQCVPFSDIDQFLKGKKLLPSCLVDSSYLIAISDKDHAQHDDSQFFYEKIVEYQIRIFTNVTVRSEFIDYHRRVIATETLMGMLAPSSKWKISSAVREILKKQKGWLSNQRETDDDAYLTDFRVKLCKQAFLPRTQSGQIGWTELCKEYFSGKLFSAWEKISEATDLHYVDMRSDDAKELFRKDLHWDSMYRLAEESALGSSDAMILNLFDCSVFPILVTSDFDLAYGVLQSTEDKVVFVPDSLYRNRLKKLRF